PAARRGLRENRADQAAAPLCRSGGRRGQQAAPSDARSRGVSAREAHLLPPSAARQRPDPGAAARAGLAARELAMTAPVGVPADRIPVSLFREILIWPLALHLPQPSAEPNGMAKAIDRIAQHIETHSRVWERQHDPTLHLPPPTREAFDDRQYPVELERWNADRYAEGVYFHEFVQSFLFRKSIANRSVLRRWRERGKRDPLAMRLYQRADITRVAVGLAPGRNFVLAVERLN